MTEDPALREYLVTAENFVAAAIVAPPGSAKKWRIEQALLQLARALEVVEQVPVPLHEAMRLKDARNKALAQENESLRRQIAALERRNAHWLPGEELGYDGKPREEEMSPTDIAAAVLTAQGGLR